MIRHFSFAAENPHKVASALAEILVATLVREIDEAKARLAQ